MIQTSGVIICLGYIFGLLFTAVPWGGVLILILGLVGAVLFRRRYATPRQVAHKPENAGNKTKVVPNIWQNAPHPRIWVAAGLVGLFGNFVFSIASATTRSKRH